MNDRQRVEAALFPSWFINILSCGVSPDERDDDYYRCQRILATAVSEALRGCDEQKSNQILRRVSRVHNAVTDDYRRNDVSVIKIGLIALYALEAVLSADYLELTEGSPLALAIDAIIEALSASFAEPRLDASARKHAGKVLSHLKSLGYFESVTLQREAA